jgi:hypothetical protein
MYTKVRSIKSFVQFGNTEEQFLVKTLREKLFLTNGLTDVVARHVATRHKAPRVPKYNIISILHFHSIFVLKFTHTTVGRQQFEVATLDRVPRQIPARKVCHEGEEENNMSSPPPPPSPRNSGQPRLYGNK